MNHRPGWAPRFGCLAAIACFAGTVQAADPVGVALPSGEDVQDWRHALDLAGCVVGTSGDAVRLVDAGDHWVIEVEDSAGATRTASIAPPRGPAQREDAIWLAKSMLQRGRSGATWGDVDGLSTARSPAAVPPPSPPVATPPAAADPPRRVDGGGAVRARPASPSTAPRGGAAPRPAAEGEGGEGGEGGDARSAPVSRAQQGAAPARTDRPPPGPPVAGAAGSPAPVDRAAGQGTPPATPATGAGSAPGAPTDSDTGPGASNPWEPTSPAPSSPSPGAPVPSSPTADSPLTPPLLAPDGDRSASVTAGASEPAVATHVPRRTAPSGDSPLVVRARVGAEAQWRPDAAFGPGLLASADLAAGRHLRVGVAGDFAPAVALADLGHERRISTAGFSATVGYALTTRFAPRLDLRGGAAIHAFLQHGTVIETIPVPTLGVDVSMGVAASSRLGVRPWLGARYDLRVVELNTLDVRWDLPQFALAGGVTIELLLGEIE